MCLVALHQSLYMTSSAISVICFLAEQQNLHTCSMFVFKMLSLMLATVQNSDLQIPLLMLTFASGQTS